LASGRFVLLCDHASNHVPAEFNNLGLTESDLSSHIAWDIGAAGVTEVLSELLDSPEVICGTSRLVIDCNRQPDHPALIPESSAGTKIPGNAALSAEEKAARIDRWFQPYHDAVEAVLSQRATRGSESIVVAIHSMTPVLHGQTRPWQIAFSSHTDRRLTELVLAALRVPGDLLVGDDEPFCIEPHVDYSIPHHALRHGLLHLQVEFRQDEIADVAAQRRWAQRFADALSMCANVQTALASRSKLPPLS
jgi:predicted N-formylglutamate amidohydrolase